MNRAELNNYVRIAFILISIFSVPYYAKSLKKLGNTYEDGKKRAMYIIGMAAGLIIIAFGVYETFF